MLITKLNKAARQHWHCPSCTGPGSGAGACFAWLPCPRRARGRSSCPLCPASPFPLCCCTAGACRVAGGPSRARAASPSSAPARGCWAGPCSRSPAGQTDTSTSYSASCGLIRSLLSVTVHTDLLLEDLERLLERYSPSTQEQKMRTPAMQERVK